MKIVAISDIHGNLNSILPPNCDILCICGDIINLNDQRNMESSAIWWKTRFVKWVNAILCKKVIIIPGNHDFYIEKLYKDLTEYYHFKKDLNDLTKGKVELLVNETFKYKGINIYGCPYIKPIGWSNWAFESSEDVNYVMPDNIDILLTHDSPFYNEKVVNFKVKYHFFGHWHDGGDCRIKNRYNCSVLTDNYNIKKDNKYVEIDIDREYTMEDLKTKIQLLEDICNDASEDTEFLDKDTYNIISCYIHSQIKGLNIVLAKLIEHTNSSEESKELETTIES